MIKKLVVYGSFRKGGSRESIFPIPKKITRVKVQGMLMYAFPELGYPGAVITDNKDDYIVGDILDFENLLNVQWKRLVKALDQIERTDIGLFKRMVVKTEDGEACIYVFTDYQMLSYMKQLYEKYGKSLPLISDWSEIDPSVE